MKYTWVSSDGRSWPETSLTFGAKATKAVVVIWELGKPGHNVNAWIQLEVLSPNKVESTKTTFSFRCERAVLYEADLNAEEVQPVLKYGASLFARNSDLAWEQTKCRDATCCALADSEFYLQV